MSVLNSEQKKKNVNKSLSEKKNSRLYDSLLRNKKLPLTNGKQECIYNIY